MIQTSPMPSSTFHSPLPPTAKQTLANVDSILNANSSAWFSEALGLIENLGNFHHATVVRALRKYATHSDYEVRRQALLSLAVNQGAKALPQLVHALEHDPRGLVRLDVLDVLRSMRKVDGTQSPAIRKAITNAVNNDNRSVNRHAISFITNPLDQTALNALGKALTHPNGQTRQLAYEKLSSFKHPNVISAWIAGIRPDDHEKEYSALRGLTKAHAALLQDSRYRHHRYVRAFSDALEHLKGLEARQLTPQLVQGVFRIALNPRERKRLQNPATRRLLFKQFQNTRPERAKTV